MTFHEPLWITLTLALLGLSLWVFIHGVRQRKKRIERFIAPTLSGELLESFSPFRRWLKGGLFLLALGLVGLALARPQWGYRWTETKSRGIDVLIALDASRSMLAEDMRPNRLERSKLAIIDLVDTLESDRIGLIAFAGSAFLQCPLTLDHDAFRLTLESVDTSVIPRGGSDIAAAINEANVAFDSASNQRVLILITDGEDHTGEGLSRAREVAEEGVRIYTVGIGTAAGTPIPVRDARGRQDYVRDEEGRLVTSRLEAVTLEAIATATEGFYVNLANNPNALQQIYQNILETVPAQERESELKQSGIDRFQIFLAIACGLLLIEPLISLRRRFFRTSSALPVVFAGVLALAGANEVFGKSPALSGQEAYERGAFERAVSAYQKALSKDPDNATFAYNLGVALYKAGDAEEARKYFDQVIESGDIPHQARAFYNLGNLSFEQGMQKLESTPKQTLKQWEEALTQYENALELNPDDTLAGENHERVEAMLRALEEELKKQEQEEQENNSQQEEEKQKEEEQDSTEQENQQQQQESSESSAGGESSDSQSSEGEQGEEGQEGQSGEQSEGSQSGEQQSESQQDENASGQPQDAQSGKPQDPTSDTENPQDPSSSPQGSEPEQSSEHSGASSSDQSDLSEGAEPEQTSAGFGQEEEEEQGGQKDLQPLTPNERANQAGDKDEGKAAGEQGEEEKEGAGKADTAAKAGEQQGTQADPNARVLPGYMTYEEARILLESMRKDERKLPFVGRGLRESDQPATPNKDW